MSKKIYEYINSLQQPNNDIYLSSQKHFDKIAKPIGSFGNFEDIICRICSIQENEILNINKKAVVVFCSDNGIVDNGITQTDKSVTLKVFKNIERNTACINRIAKYSNADVIAVDSGINADITYENSINGKIAKGTKNFINSPAMERKEAEKAILFGIKLAEKIKKQGYNICAAGEMGIGNTTTSAAVTSCILNLEPSDVTGRGAGLSDELYLKKIKVIEEGIKINNPVCDDVLDVLSKMGGFDIAQMCGFYIGCAYFKLPCIVDGFIALTAALCSVKLNSITSKYLIPSHKSSEKGVAHILKFLDMYPIIDGDMHQGEGTGAAMLFPLLDMCADIYLNQATFEKVEITPYERYGEILC